MRLWIFIFAALTNIFNALSNGYKDLSWIHPDVGMYSILFHLFQVLTFASLLIAAWYLVIGYWKWWVLILELFLTRIALFDYTINIVKGMPLSHRGTGNLWDLAIGWAPESWFVMVRILALIFAIHFSYKLFINHKYH